MVSRHSYKMNEEKVGCIDLMSSSYSPPDPKSLDEDDRWVALKLNNTHKQSLYSTSAQVLSFLGMQVGAL